MNEDYKKRYVMDNDTGEWIIKLIAALGGWKILEWIISWREKKENP